MSGCVVVHRRVVVSVVCLCAIVHPRVIVYVKSSCAVVCLHVLVCWVRVWLCVHM